MITIFPSESRTPPGESMRCTVTPGGVAIIEDLSLTNSASMVTNAVSRCVLKRASKSAKLATELMLDCISSSTRALNSESSARSVLFALSA